MLNSAAVVSVNESKCITISGPSPGHCPLGLGRSLDARWMENLAGGRRELDDCVVCCKAPRTEISAAKLIIATF